MSETKKNVRAKKRAVMKQINVVKQLIAEDEADKIAQVLVLKKLFREFIEANNRHFEKLEEIKMWKKAPPAMRRPKAATLKHYLQPKHTKKTRKVRLPVQPRL